MRRNLALVSIVVAIPLACAPTVRVGSSASAGSTANQPLDGAYRARQALDRLTFGARPGDLALVERMGVDAWIDRQLHPDRIPDRAADSVLDRLEITHKSALELAADHPQPNEFGLNPIKPATRPETAAVKRATAADSMSAMAELTRLRAQAEQSMARASIAVRLNQARAGAVRELPTSILLRATLSDRQLLEVMTDFWENHFSVSADKMPSPFALVDYDRVIRAHALGKFRDLLGAVATSPAMLFYLDNYQSSVDSLHPTPTEWEIEQRRAAHPPLGDTSLIHAVARRRTGVNENYARELMELHTLGVDGGYSQTDVQEVARCLTGWGITDFQYGGRFAFQPDRHDAGEKVVLGVHIPGGRGIEDGQEVLDILARSPATAHFIARKLVVHFVSDDPPPALVERAAQTYMRTDGNIGEVLRTIFTSPEFNSRAAYRAKVKTPFELVASILRSMNAAPDTTPQAVQLLARLGEPLFGRSSPDGWPDVAEAWMNTGALLNRINLGQQVGANQLPSVRIARWAPAQGLIAMGPAQQVNGVIGVLLNGDASDATRSAMSAIASAPRTMAHIGELVSIVIGSSDFQRR